MTSTFTATLPTFHTAVQALQATARGGERDAERAGLGAVSPSAASPAHPTHHTAQFSTKETAAAISSSPYSSRTCDVTSRSSTQAFSTHTQKHFSLDTRGEKTLQGDDIHLHCCFVSKVRRQLGILQLRRGNGTSCYWQGTDVWGKVGIQQPFFFWQKSTRETPETLRDCHPMKERPLNIQGGWHANSFWFHTPETSDCWSCQRLRAKGDAQRLPLHRHHNAFRVRQLSCGKYGDKGGRKYVELTASSPSAKAYSCVLVSHTVHALMYTQANTHIQTQDVGSQFSKHSPYPLLL